MTGVKSKEVSLVLSSSLSLSPLREMKHKNNPGWPFPYWISPDDKVESLVLNQHKYAKWISNMPLTASGRCNISYKSNTIKINQ